MRKHTADFKNVVFYPLKTSLCDNGLEGIGKKEVGRNVALLCDSEIPAVK